MKISVARITTMRPVWTEDVYHVDRRCSKSRGAKMYVDLTHVFQFEVTKMYPFPVGLTMMYSFESTKNVSARGEP